MYEWLKNGQPYAIDGLRVVWKRSGQSGTISFLEPDTTDQGGYQCRASNIFGVALSNIFEVRLGKSFKGHLYLPFSTERKRSPTALDHFANRPPQEVLAKLGQPLTLPCSAPYGVPRPTIFWLFRNARQSFVIETIDRPHISVDGDGNLRFSHVETHDGRENLIYQCAATSPVLHGEYRAGDEISLKVVNATAPEWVDGPPQNVDAAEDGDIELRCEANGAPSPKVQWFKNGVLLDDNVERMSMSNQKKILQIFSVQQKIDRAVYQCNASNTLGYVFANAYVNVRESI
uniref:protein-tyrosine-phosphatase n=1 Tax=Romanomermis culicivorax TaxID=13658 RepID=A0A915JKP3_ROMCU